MKKAFTMLELVFIIIVIGILAAVMLPRLDNKPLYQAAMEVVSQIRYTQHLAMQDDKLDPADPTWYRNRWQIRFENNKYSIVSDKNTTYAKDPMDVSGAKEFKNIDLAKKYGVSIPKNVTISFDHLGRPLIGNASSDPYDGLLKNDLNITISDGSESKKIVVSPETGYVRIVN